MHEGTLCPGRTAQIDPDAHAGSLPQVQPELEQSCAAMQARPKQMAKGTSAEPSTVAAAHWSHSARPPTSHTVSPRGATHVHSRETNASSRAASNLCATGAHPMATSDSATSRITARTPGT